MAILIGDSWAKPVLARMLGAELIRYPGCTAMEIAGKLTAIVQADCAFLVCGVNDRLRHVGPACYAQGIREIVRALDCERIMVLELPDIDERRVQASATSRMYHWAMRWMNDAGEHNVTQAYREALRSVQGIEIVSCEYGQGEWHDAAHINEAGMRRLAEAFEERVSHGQYA